MTSLPVQMMDEPGEQAGSYTADRQVGKKGNCYVAQVFGPNGDSVLTVDPTDDPAEASRIAAVCAAALSAPVAPVPEPAAAPRLNCPKCGIAPGLDLICVCPADPVDAKPAERQPDGDPLQGAATWLVNGLFDCTTADIQARLLIGYNRAKRLHDAALQAKPAESGT